MTEAGLKSLVLDKALLKKHLFKVGAIAASLALFSFLFLDQRTSAFFAQPEIKQNFRKTARTITDLGLSEFYFLFTIILFFLSFSSLRLFKLKVECIRRINLIKNWSLNFLASLILSGLLTHIIKFTVGRQRPHKSETFEPAIFVPFNTHWHWQSFSSGHSQVIFTVATILMVTLPKQKYLWLLGAVCIALTRVIVHDHFLSDVIIGSFVGYAGTLLTLNFFSQKKMILFLQS